FPDVSVEIVDTKSVRFVRARFGRTPQIFALVRAHFRPLPRIPVIAGVEVGVDGREVVSRLVEVEIEGTVFLRPSPAPTSIFPFLFRGQSIQPFPTPLLLLIQFPNELLGILP